MSEKHSCFSLPIGPTGYSTKSSNRLGLLLSQVISNQEIKWLLKKNPRLSLEAVGRF